MPEWLAGVTLGQLVAVGAVILVAGGFLARIVPAFRKLSRLADAFLGVPESFPGAGDARSGVLDRITGLEAELREVRQLAQATHAELRPNGGTSTRDRIDDIARKIDRA